uniref:Uncharacterized protein n=1 Tax=Setaria viridis TaxID=4556 RepID=A0A4U6WEU0_SETVI|nr:hypothetical protein SEVIR_1G191033v2 [Setaria viridis]
MSKLMMLMLNQPTMLIIAQMTCTSNYALCAPNKLFFQLMCKRML